MERILYICDVLLNTGSILYFIAVFYLSMRGSFAEEKIHRGKLVFLSLIVNPLSCFFISLAIAGVVGRLIMMSLGMEYDTSQGMSGVVTSVAEAVIYLLIILLFAELMARKIDIRSKLPILYLFLMYNTIFINQIRTFDTVELFGIPGAGYILNIVSGILSTLSIWFFYRYCAQPLIAISMDGTKIAWRIFIIPPAAFIFFYTLFCTLDVLLGDDTVMVVFSAFSMLIVCLFIWAFYVIIKNIKATNEAEKAKEELKTLSVEVMEALAHTIDAKDVYTRGHSVRVAKYSRMLATRLGLSLEDCENVYYMALLHDIGKIGVPNSIINSPTKLTDEEYAIIKTHPKVGYDILDEIKSRPDLAIGARWHHERYDGKGYPDGKSGEDIPYYARIIAVADSYDAMTSNRSYRKYMPQDAVRFEIEKNIGTQFDPVVARCMLAIINADVDYRLHE